MGTLFHLQMYTFSYRKAVIRPQNMIHFNADDTRAKSPSQSSQSSLLQNCCRHPSLIIRLEVALDSVWSWGWSSLVQLGPTWEWSRQFNFSSTALLDCLSAETEIWSLIQAQVLQYLQSYMGALLFFYAYSATKRAIQYNQQQIRKIESGYRPARPRLDPRARIQFCGVLNQQGDLTYLL